jgi:tellurite resistance protein
MSIDHHDALIYSMLLVSAADGDMTDKEMTIIGEAVRSLPIFADYDIERLPKATKSFAKLMSDEDGLEGAIKAVKKNLPKHLRETAYALAVEVVAVDQKASQEELRMLEMMRHRLDVERLAAAGIERGAAARYARA